MEDIDYNRLREDLIEYFGTAMFNGSPLAIIEISKIEYATDEELIDIAQKTNFNLEKYIKE